MRPTAVAKTTTPSTLDRRLRRRRGICPSCTARRAEDTAAQLVDHVLPRVPYRQWVFTFPIPVRLALSR